MSRPVPNRKEVKNMENYREQIAQLLQRIDEEKKLRYIYIIVKDIVGGEDKDDQ